MLDLLGGFHPGPLFVVCKKRPPVRPLKKAGIIHRRQTKRATPKWLTDADRARIRAAYREARQRTEQTGELHVVDHIVPKISPLVCGLHVPWNLRVIHWRDNAKKGAWTWPNMPNEQLELLED